MRNNIYIKLFTLLKTSVRNKQCAIAHMFSHCNRIPYPFNCYTSLLNRRKMKFVCFFLVFGILLSQYFAVYAKLYRRCELAHQLLAKYKFERTYLSNCKYTSYTCQCHMIVAVIMWSFDVASSCLGICLIEAESGLDTSKVNAYWPIYESFGLFQINNKKWCRKGYIGGVCNARCESKLLFHYFFTLLPSQQCNWASIVDFNSRFYR